MGTILFILLTFRVKKAKLNELIIVKGLLGEKITETLVIYNIIFQKITIIDSTIKIIPFKFTENLQSKDNIPFEVKGKVYSKVTIDQGINYINEKNTNGNFIIDLESILIEVSKIYNYESLESRSKNYKKEILVRLNNINKNIVNVEDIAIDYLYKKN